MPENYVLQHFMWESTRKCNLGCKHCGSDCGSALQDELSTKEAKAMIEDVAGMGAIFFSITGGEPLTRPDIFELVGYANSLGLNVTLITNGSLVTDETAERLASCGLKAVAISIDGTREYHNANRGQSFNKALGALELFKKHGVTTCASMMVCDSNHSMVRETHELCESNGIDRLNLYLPQEVGRAKDNSITLGLDKMVDLIEYNIENKDSSTPLFLDDGFGPYNDHFECTAGRSHICVSADGEIRPCISFPFAIGNVRQMKVSEAWKSSMLDAFRNFDFSKLGEPCRNCAIVESCGGGCRARALQKYGSFYAGNKECQQIAREKPTLLSRALKVGALAGLATSLVFTGCVQKDLQPPEHTKIKGVYFDLDENKSVCVGLYNPLLELETDEKLDLERIALRANGYPIDFNLSSHVLSEGAKYKYELNFSTGEVLDDWFVENNGSTLSFDYLEDDVLFSEKGLEKISLKGVFPIKEGYPINVYLAPSFELSEENVGVEVNNVRAELVRLVKLKDNLYLVTVSGDDIKLSEENELKVKVNRHTLSKKFSTISGDKFYVEKGFVSICPMISTPRSIHSVNQFGDTLVVNPATPILPGVTEFNLSRVELNEEGFPGSSELVKAGIKAERVDGYGHILSFDEALDEGSYVLTPVNENVRPYMSGAVYFSTSQKTRQVHVLKGVPVAAYPFHLLGNGSVSD